MPERAEQVEANARAVQEAQLVEAGQSHATLQIGTLSLSSQQAAIAYLGAGKAGDVILLSRALHGDEKHGPGDGVFEAWVVGADAASGLQQR